MRFKKFKTKKKDNKEKPKEECKKGEAGILDLIEQLDKPKKKERRRPKPREKKEEACSTADCSSSS